METGLAETTSACQSETEITQTNFDSIVRQNQRRIYRLLFLCLGDGDAADTLTQDCFLRAFETRARFRRECSVETWLVRIAVNLARDHAKNRRRAFWRRLVRGEKVIERGGPDPHLSPEDILLAREGVAAVWSAVEDLSHQQKIVFVLRFAEEMALEQVAATLGIELGTVKAHLSRALGTLRRRLQGEGNAASK